MTTNPLPDLSKWHEVPADTDIPIGARYAFIDEDGDWATGPKIHSGRRAVCRDSTIRYFTAEPIPALRPTPPTEPGTVLTDVTDTYGARWHYGYYLPFCSPPWALTDTVLGSSCRVEGDVLVSWTVADVVPRTPDPLNENDHRDRVEGRGIRLTRGECGRWHATNLSCRATHSLSSLTLADWAENYGPLRFADGADQS